MKPPLGAVLLVDDEELNRDMLSRRLELQSYQVTVAESGRQALALLEKQAFDLVLLDVMMPDLSGLQVLRRLRQDHEPADLPVIIITGFYTESSAIEEVNLGVAGYLTKPFRVPQVLAAAAKALGE